MAVRAGAIFPNLTVTLFEQRHHFDPPHRVEPDRTARVLRAHWARVGDTRGAPFGATRPS
jgi:hypothetical protein